MEEEEAFEEHKEPVLEPIQVQRVESHLKAYEPGEEVLLRLYSPVPEETLQTHKDLLPCSCVTSSLCREETWKGGYGEYEEEDH